MDPDELPHSSDDGASTRVGVVSAVAERSVAVVGVAVVGCFVTALVTYAWGCVRVWTFVRLLFDEGADTTLGIVRLLQVLDVFLLGTVLLITAIGLVELFITPLRMPRWLVIASLDDLKGKIIDVIVLVAAIKFLEKLATSDEALDVLWYGLAVSVVIAALVLVGVSKRDSGRS